MLEVLAMLLRTSSAIETLRLHFKGLEYRKVDARLRSEAVYGDPSP
jgi:uncharacterized protein (DUF1684 family)